MAKYLTEADMEAVIQADEPVAGLGLTIQQATEVLSAVNAFAQGLHVLEHMGRGEDDWPERNRLLKSSFEAIQRACHAHFHLKTGVACLDPDNLAICLHEEQPGDPFAGGTWSRLVVGDHLGPGLTRL